MKKHSDNIRSRLALFQAVLFCLIVASGTVFMHKHKTRDGRIIIHTHPYNLKADPATNPHHQSETEIYLLDAIFQGRFLQTDFTTYEQPVIKPFTVAYRPYRTADVQLAAIYHRSPRAPPYFN
ncbi:hypothetical protein [Parapedobacter sp. 10938]|uniref:hypothetical protein n=1 Tax=Parapedobacter flavus TaxID=3110225 RepID=UPI002DBD508A|nr:hypothetical protein [Parapedobacter sp. 10938]MEC3880500.1 hypothetical protein [Parapedobacter sp. 10938]